MANYLSAIKKTLQWEGGYSKRTDDPETYRGITRTNHPDWGGWPVIDRVKPKHNQIIPELESDVILFYKKNYWDKIHLDSVNDPIAGFVLDTFVHSGYAGIRMLQRALHLKDDGIVGSNTISALNNTTIGILKAARVKYVKSLNKPQFERGWINRINSF